MNIRSTLLGLFYAAAAYVTPNALAQSTTTTPPAVAIDTTQPITAVVNPDTGNLDGINVSRVLLNGIPYSAVFTIGTDGQGNLFPITSKTSPLPPSTGSANNNPTPGTYSGPATDNEGNDRVIVSQTVVSAYTSSGSLSASSAGTPLGSANWDTALQASNFTKLPISKRVLATGIDPDVAATMTWGQLGGQGKGNLQGGELAAFILTPTSITIIPYVDNNGKDSAVPSTPIKFDYIKPTLPAANGSN